LVRIAEATFVKIKMMQRNFAKKSRHLFGGIFVFIQF
jgi:hypothetical protein